MDVAGDALLRDARIQDVEDRCDTELELLNRIKEVPLDSKQRCRLVWNILQGVAPSAIDEEMAKYQRESAGQARGRA